VKNARFSGNTVPIFHLYTYCQIYLVFARFISNNWQPLGKALGCISIPTLGQASVEKNASRYYNLRIL